MMPAGQRAECGRDHGVGRRPGRGDAARDKGRRIEFVIGDQDQAAAKNVGAGPRFRSPGRGELVVRRWSWRGPAVRADTGGEFVDNPPSVRITPALVRSSAGRSASASWARRIWQRAITAESGQCRRVRRRSACRARVASAGRRRALRARATRQYLRASRWPTARSRPAHGDSRLAVLDQADRRADHRHQRLGTGVARGPAGIAQGFDLVGTIAPLGVYPERRPSAKSRPRLT